MQQCQSIPIRNSHTPDSGLTWLQRHERQGEFILSSMDSDAREKRDLDALLSFRKAITADPFGKLSHWTAENSDNICSWYGIRCRRHTTRVVAIDLREEYSEGMLEGTLSQSLGNLSLLCNFNLSGNTLAGKIPPEFGQLKALRVLDLRGNLNNGSIPIELSLLYKLRTFDLSLNALTGRLPPEFGQLKALRVLDLSGNLHSGSIPITITLANLTKLTRLSLFNNDFTGSIPVTLGNLTQLTYLDLSQNRLIIAFL